MQTTTCSSTAVGLPAGNWQTKISLLRSHPFFKSISRLLTNQERMNLAMLVLCGGTAVHLDGATLEHRYSFDSPASGVLVPGIEQDLVRTADAIVWGGQYMGPSDPNNPGTMLLDSIKFAYLDLPNGIISARTNLTVELWVKPNDAGGDWQRFWDFGTSTIGEIGPELPPPVAEGLEYLMLSAKVGDNNSSRLEFKTPGFTNGWVQTAWSALPRGQRHHLVAIYEYDARIMSLWLNGELVGTQTVNMPLSQLRDVNNWIGRSNWPQHSFVNAYYDEFRIYEGVLSPLQIAVNSLVGPDSFITDPGPPTAINIVVVTTNLFAQSSIDADALADFGNITGVPVDELGATWISTDTDVVTVSGTGLVTAVGAGSADVWAVYSGLSNSIMFKVEGLSGPVAVDMGLRAYDGNSIIRIACEAPVLAGTLSSPVRVARNGTNYGIILVETNAPDASEVQLQTRSGIKAWKKLP